MQVYRLCTARGHETEQVLGHYTTVEALEQDVVRLAREGQVTRAIETTTIDVTGEPVVIVVVDQAGKLIGGPFDTQVEAAVYANDDLGDDDCDISEWTCQRFAYAHAEQAVAADRVRVLHRLESLGRSSSDGSVRFDEVEWDEIRAELNGTTS